MSGRINILYQFDEKYAPYAGISLFSLLKNNKQNNVYVYFAAMGVSEDNTTKIEMMCEAHSAIVTWLDTKEAQQQIEKLKVGSWNNSYATWLKVFVLNQIPDDVERLLYIDCDTLIMGDLAELFSLDMQGKAVAAVMDCLEQHSCSRLNVQKYYNAGVTLYDLEQMRSRNMFDEMLSHLAKNVDRYPVNDQDLLNDFFADDIYTLSLKYNMQGFLYMYDTANYLAVYISNHFYTNKEIDRAKCNPVIVHFFRIFGDYPWEKNNEHACTAMFNEWKKQSLWSDKEDLERVNEITFLVEKILYKILPQKFFLKIYKFIVER